MKSWEYYLTLFIVVIILSAIETYLGFEVMVKAGIILIYAQIIYGRIEK